jgi:hypothetical protein
MKAERPQTRLLLTKRSWWAAIKHKDAEPTRLGALLDSAPWHLHMGPNSSSHHTLADGVTPRTFASTRDDMPTPMPAAPRPSPRHRRRRCLPRRG